MFEHIDIIELVIDLLAVVGGSGLLAAVVPNASKLDGVLLVARKVLDVLAANVANAKNKD
jgi:hypothetical protein